MFVMNTRAPRTSWRRTLTATLLTPALALGVTVSAGTAVAGEAQSQADNATGAANAASTASTASIPTVADPGAFFAVPSSDEIADIAPGTPLKQRSVTAKVAGLETPAAMTQIQYRTTTVNGAPTAAVTSVLHPPQGVPRTGDTVMYASFYDSMNPSDGPSRMLARGAQTELLDFAEAAFVTPLLAEGHSVIMPDIQGERGIFAAGKEYAYIILDGIRASRATPKARIAADSKTALTGYSGGSIGAAWSAVMAEDYAPDVASDIVGVAQGGVMPRTEHNLHYAGEGSKWSGVVGMALAGLANAYDDDLTPYLTDYGQRVVSEMQGVHISDAQDRYAHLRWEELFRAEYPTPDDVPPVRRVLDDTNLGLVDSPSYPQYIAQAGGGAEQQGTPVHPTLGDGDGVMLLGDSRALARQYCEAGTRVTYEEYGPIGHTYAGALWAAKMLPWVNARFDGGPSPSSCGSVPAGNSLTAPVR